MRRRRSQDGVHPGGDAGLFWLTLSTIRLGIAANARPILILQQRREQDLHGCDRATVSSPNERSRTPPRRAGVAATKRRSNRPASRPITTIASVDGTGGGWTVIDASSGARLAPDVPRTDE
jgi:hypothetical protein